MTAPDRRTVMFVRNDVSRDARVLREAAALHAAGWEVTIVGLLPASSPLPVSELVSGVRILRIAAPVAWRAQWRNIRYYPWRARSLVLPAIRGATARGPAGWPQAALIGLVAVAWAPFTVGRAIQYVLSRRRQPQPSPIDDALDWLVRWQWSVVGWGAGAAAAAPDADVFHGHDLSGLPAALAARDRRAGLVVYDSHEIFTEAAGVARRPPWARALLARRERAWAGRCDLVVTVNEAVAAELRRRLGRSAIAVVHNAPPTPPGGSAAEEDPQPADAPAAAPDALRAAAGIEAGVPIVLYHGALIEHRGIEQFAESILRPGLEEVEAVILGYGNARSTFEALAAEARFSGRLHLVDSVAPDVLVDVIRTADVGVMAIQPTTLNHRLATPNKLFECLAAGVPVVASDLPGMRRIVLDDPDGPLGEVCDPTDADSIAAAIRRVLELSADERADLRRRCRRAARLRWNWETESAVLVRSYAEMAARAASGVPQP